MKTNKMCAIFNNQHEYNELKPLTEKRCLSTLYFAGKYRLMDFPLSSIVHANIHSVYMLVNQSMLQSYFDHLDGGKEWGFDMIGHYFLLGAFQDLVNQRMDGELYLSDLINFINCSGAGYVALLGNKMLSNVDLDAVLKYHQSQGAKVTAVVKKADKTMIASDDQLFDLDEDNRVRANYRIDEAPDAAEYNLSMNMYVMDADWLIELLKKGEKNGQFFNMAADLGSVMTKYHGACYEYTGYIRNIHDIPSYFAANMDMLNKEHFDSLLNSGQKIITRIKNEVGTYYAQGSAVTNSLVSTGCRIYGRVDHAVISRRCRFEKNTTVKNSIILSNVVLHEGTTIENAILDKNVEVDAGVTIKGTKDHPIVVEKGGIINTNMIAKGAE